MFGGYVYIIYTKHHNTTDSSRFIGNDDQKGIVALMETISYYCCRE
jgi:hypothetical protein